MSKTVRIQAGQWKGYIGTVSHTTATHVQVELHSRLKKVMVVKDRVHVIGDKFGATGETSDSANGFAAPSMSYMSASTPMHGGATPMYGGATPMHGGATPMHDGYGYVSCACFSLCLLRGNYLFSIYVFHFPAVDRPLRTQACPTTFGGLVDLLIATPTSGTMGQLLAVDGVFLKTVLHRFQTIHL
jgi:hypothetical protein